MLVKEKLSGISLYSLIPQKSVKPRILIKDEPLLSSPFIISQNRSINSKFTGRIKELDYLRALYSETISNLKKQNGSTGQFYKPIIAAVSGEPGIGKSRLINEFIKRIKANSQNEINNFLYGRNLSTQQPNGMFTDIVKLSGFRTGSTVKNENNAAVNNLIKESIFRTAFEVNKLDLPLVIAFEDMQWADESSIGALEHIIRSINLYTESKQPQILFIINYRNKFKPSKTLRTETDYREISLGGFTEKETESFIVNLSGSGSITGKSREIITERSDGNPFNIEEWCSLLGENKKLSRIPESIRQLLVEKVTNLLPEERSVLIIACVLGRKFDLKILSWIQKRAGKEQVTNQVMQSLMDKRFLINLTDDIYEFRHDILQETIYRQLETELKQNVHQLAGNAIEELFPSKISDYYYELARHYTAAKKEAKSIIYLEKAGDKAKDNYEHERALRYYIHLLKLITGDNKHKITFKICDVYMNRSEWNKQIELCNSILKQSRRLDKSIKAECYKRTGHALRLKGDYKQALQVYKKAFRIYELLKDIQSKLNIIEHEAKVMMVMGKYKESLNSFEIIYKISKDQKFNDSYKNSLIGLGIVNSKIGKYDDTIKYNDELFRYSVNNNDKQGILTSKINKAEALYFMGEYDKAYSLYSEALVQAEKINQIQDIQVCIGNLGIIFYSKHDYKKALNFFKKQLNGFISLSDKAGISRAYGLIGSCYISLNDYANALFFLFKQLKICIELKRKQTIALCFGNIGIVYALKGEFDKAENFYIKQEYTENKLSNIEGKFRVKLNLAILYLNKKNYSKALKNFKGCIKIAQKNNIQSNICIAHSYYSETLYNLKNYKFAIKNAELSVKESEKNLNNVIKIHSKAIIIKSRMKQIVGVDKSAELNMLLSKFKQELKYVTTIEEKAMIYYELCQILKIMRVGIKYKKRFKSYIKLALNYYKKLYERSKNFFYKERIDELSLFGVNKLIT